MIRLITVLGISVLIFSGECAGAEERRNDVIDAKAGSVAGISVGMTEAEIRKSGRLYQVRTEILEGDEYKVYELRLADDVRLECTLDLENTVYEIESSSIEVRDQQGLGANSRLGELKRAYPAGRLIIGSAEGRFANFLTATRLTFHFDHEDFEESCFDHRRECAIDDSVVVRSISIGTHAPK